MTVIVEVRIAPVLRIVVNREGVAAVRRILEATENVEAINVVGHDAGSTFLDVTVADDRHRASEFHVEKARAEIARLLTTGLAVLGMSATVGSP